MILGHQAVLVAVWPPKAPVIADNGQLGEYNCRIHIKMPCGHVGTNICGFNAGLDAVCPEGHRMQAFELCLN